MPSMGDHIRPRLLGTILAFSALAALSTFTPPSARPVAAAVPAAATPIAEALSYADLADLALHADVVAGVTVTRAERLKGELAPGLTPGRARFLVQANTAMLLRGPDGTPAMLTYIVDVPLNPAGKPPRLKKGRFILVADRVPGRPQEVRLTSPASQIEWTAPVEARVRAILTEAIARSAPPAVTGIGNAFYIPGSVPGESESQIFLTTSDGRPISLSILRRPG